MDTIAAVLREKGQHVYSISPEATVLEAARAMDEHNVGSLLVVKNGQPVGIFSERDLMRRVVVLGKNPAKVKVGEVMSREVTVVEPDTRVKEAMAIMTERRCRHLPVVEQGRVVGLVSIGDLVRWISRDQEFQIRMLEAYITGSYPQ
ncbi:MAG: CBS domain-containing protein [Thermoanaerobaculum sp.]|nr:CBS domain-containing protein [Thermoanaerobaculum sp.]MDW7968164.1 CBS domain-containing protein [Thermoanaerobaculum sp.]